MCCCLQFWANMAAAANGVLGSSFLLVSLAFRSCVKLRLILALLILPILPISPLNLEKLLHAISHPHLMLSSPCFHPSTPLLITWPNSYLSLHNVCVSHYCCAVCSGIGINRYHPDSRSSQLVRATMALWTGKSLYAKAILGLFCKSLMRPNTACTHHAALLASPLKLQPSLANTLLLSKTYEDPCCLPFLSGCSRMGWARCACPGFMLQHFCLCLCHIWRG